MALTDAIIEVHPTEVVTQIDAQTVADQVTKVETVQVQTTTTVTTDSKDKIPLFCLIDFDSIPLSPTPNFNLTEIRDLCFSEDFSDFDDLVKVQSTFLNEFNPTSSIHSMSAINYYTKILKAPQSTLDILYYGYSPGVNKINLFFNI